ncbi:hypothetical protein Tco_1478330, partial [Tanacetum coccineum]
ARRDLRQGDPISSYLFTLVMEVLNLMVVRQVKAKKRFKYQWGCKELKITSLCLADDLLMLFPGDLYSASVLRIGLDEFSLSSGFHPRVLPIKYLGVPMVSKILHDSDCKVLIKVFKKRIRDWWNKVLSFAGKLQLIASVLNSIQVYWSSLFMLHISVCNKIDKLLKSFLWSRNDSISGMASVA